MTKISRSTVDAESCKEQDNAKHFSIRSRMTELWPNLCENVGKKEEEGLFCFFLPKYEHFYWRCLPMRPFQSEFNGELSLSTIVLNSRD